MKAPMPSVEEAKAIIARRRARRLRMRLRTAKRLNELAWRFDAWFTHLSPTKQRRYVESLKRKEQPVDPQHSRTQV